MPRKKNITAKELTNQIRIIFKDNKYPILIDQEGGRVSRLEMLLYTESLTGEFFSNEKNYTRADV